jgi:iron complex outermembrane receptor protein
MIKRLIPRDLSPSMSPSRLCDYIVKFICLSAFVNTMVVTSYAQDSESLSSVQKLKKLSVEELMDIEVTSVSMRSEKLTEVASAVQVITAEDIKRSGATRLPEALRLVSNLQVSQANSHDWAITARGFNGLPSAGGILANKLLVMIDGRSVYNPLFGGVYWDVQNVLIEDIDRIEVVSGPGGTLWGANAVNGVINIVTKQAKDTQGLYASAGTGSFLKDMVMARYGFKMGDNLFMRVYGQHMNQRHTFLAGDRAAKDAWEMTQTGFRLDYSPSYSKNLTIQGDFYRGIENDSVTRAHTDGQNILARFQQHFENRTDLTLQFYFDRTWRKTPLSATPFFYDLSTYDMDAQYRFPLGKNQSILVGLDYRFQKDQVPAGLSPLSRSMPLYSGFVQDEISLPAHVKLTIGSKFLHNIFSGFEVQPSARLAWTPSSRHTLWTAVSHAVRVPTRFDSDATTSSTPFDSEKVTAYEAGYRMQPVTNLSFSLALFFNSYRQLRSLDSAQSPPPPVVIANSQRAESWGAEFSARYQANAHWLLRGGYTYFQKNIWAVGPKVFPISESFEGVDFKGNFIVQSVLDIGYNWQFDVVGRYVTSLPGIAPTVPRIPEYFTLDLRLAWVYKSLELSVVGQNLLEKDHPETGVSRISRTFYGRLTWRM